MTLIEIFIAMLALIIGLTPIFMMQKHFERNRRPLFIEAITMSFVAFVAGTILFSGLGYSFGLFEGRPNKLDFLREIVLFAGGGLSLFCAALYLIKWGLETVSNYLKGFQS